VRRQRSVSKAAAPARSGSRSAGRAKSRDHCEKNEQGDRARRRDCDRECDRDRNKEETDISPTVGRRKSENKDESRQRSASGQKEERSKSENHDEKREGSAAARSPSGGDGIGGANDDEVATEKADDDDDDDDQASDDKAADQKAAEGEAEGRSSEKDQPEDAGAAKEAKSASGKRKKRKHKKKGKRVEKRKADAGKDSKVDKVRSGSDDDVAKIRDDPADEEDRLHKSEELSEGGKAVSTARGPSEHRKPTSDDEMQVAENGKDVKTGSAEASADDASAMKDPPEGRKASQKKSGSKRGRKKRKRKTNGSASDPEDSRRAAKKRKDKKSERKGFSKRPGDEDETARLVGKGKARDSRQRSKVDPKDVTTNVEASEHDVDDAPKLEQENKEEEEPNSEQEEKLGVDDGEEEREEQGADAEKKRSNGEQVEDSEVADDEAGKEQKEEAEDVEGEFDDGQGRNGQAEAAPNEGEKPDDDVVEGKVEKPSDVGSARGTRSGRRLKRRKRKQQGNIKHINKKGTMLKRRGGGDIGGSSSCSSSSTSRSSSSGSSGSREKSRHKQRVPTKGTAQQGPPMRGGSMPMFMPGFFPGSMPFPPPPGMRFPGMHLPMGMASGLPPPPPGVFFLPHKVADKDHQRKRNENKVAAKRKEDAELRRQEQKNVKAAVGVASGCDQSADERRAEVVASAVPATASGETEELAEKYRTLIKGVYARRNPSKLLGLETLLRDKYHGSEAEVYRHICSKYSEEPEKPSEGALEAAAAAASAAFAALRAFSEVEPVEDAAAAAVTAVQGARDFGVTATTTRASASQGAAIALGGTASEDASGWPFFYEAYSPNSVLSSDSEIEADKAARLPARPRAAPVVSHGSSIGASRRYGVTLPPAAAAAVASVKPQLELPETADAAVASLETLAAPSAASLSTTAATLDSSATPSRGRWQPPPLRLAPLSAPIAASAFAVDVEEESAATSGHAKGDRRRALRPEVQPLSQGQPASPSCSSRSAPASPSAFGSLQRQVSPPAEVSRAAATSDVAAPAESTQSEIVQRVKAKRADHAGFEGGPLVSTSDREGAGKDSPEKVAAVEPTPAACAVLQVEEEHATHVNVEEDAADVSGGVSRVQPQREKVSAAAQQSPTEDSPAGPADGEQASPTVESSTDDEANAEMLEQAAAAQGEQHQPHSPHSKVGSDVLTRVGKPESASKLEDPASLFNNDASVARLSRDIEIETSKSEVPDSRSAAKKAEGNRAKELLQRYIAMMNQQQGATEVVGAPASSSVASVPAAGLDEAQPSSRAMAGHFGTMPQGPMPGHASTVVPPGPWQQGQPLGHGPVVMPPAGYAPLPPHAALHGPGTAVPFHAMGFPAPMWMLPAGFVLPPGMAPSGMLLASGAQQQASRPC